MQYGGDVPVPFKLKSTPLSSSPTEELSKSSRVDDFYGTGSVFVTPSSSMSYISPSRKHAKPVKGMLA